MSKGYWLVQTDITDPERHLRVGAADGDVVIVEGYDGTQPAEFVAQSHLAAPTA